MIPLYTLIRSKRKTLALQISQNGEIFVRAPRLYPKFLIEKFLIQKKEWIEKSKEKMQQNGNPGKKYDKMEIQEMKEKMKAYLDTRIPEIWEGKNLPNITSIKITKSERRWGSCSGKNGLCFSYRLAEYLEKNPKFIDAVIVHELAHLVEKNHQKSFWNLVYQMMPEYEKIMQSRNVDNH